jgi:hypothetical protein
MSKQVPIDEPLTDEHREYLVMMGETSLIDRIDAQFAGDDDEAPAYSGDVNAQTGHDNPKYIQQGDVNNLSNAEEALEVLEYKNWTKNDLVAEAKERGLAHTGTKDELAARLAEDDDTSEEE